jgi:hypothetical protein
MIRLVAIPMRTIRIAALMQKQKNNQMEVSFLLAPCGQTATETARQHKKAQLKTRRHVPVPSQAGALLHGDLLAALEAACSTGEKPRAIPMYSLLCGTAHTCLHIYYGKVLARVLVCVGVSMCVMKLFASAQTSGEPIIVSAFCCCELGGRATVCGMAKTGVSSISGGRLLRYSS